MLAEELYLLWISHVPSLLSSLRAGNVAERGPRRGLRILFSTASRHRSGDPSTHGLKFLTFHDVQQTLVIQTNGRITKVILTVVVRFIWYMMNLSSWWCWSSLGTKFECAC